MIRMPYIQVPFSNDLWFIFSSVYNIATCASRKVNCDLYDVMKQIEGVSSLIGETMTRHSSKWEFMRIRDHVLKFNYSYCECEFAGALSGGFILLMIQM